MKLSPGWGWRGKFQEGPTSNQPVAAHETLEAARDIIAALRHRNQVVVYSDYMNDYHAQMEKVLIAGPKIIDQPGGMQQVTAMVGALDYLARKQVGEAPAIPLPAPPTRAKRAHSAKCVKFAV
jgi:hypothetical protein